MSLVVLWREEQQLQETHVTPTWIFHTYFSHGTKDAKENQLDIHMQVKNLDLYLTPIRSIWIIDVNDTKTKTIRLLEENTNFLNFG